MKDKDGILYPNQTISNAKKWFKSLTFAIADTFCNSNQEILKLRDDYLVEQLREKQLPQEASTISDKVKEKHSEWLADICNYILM